MSDESTLLPAPVFCEACRKTHRPPFCALAGPGGTTGESSQEAQEAIRLRSRLEAANDAVDRCERRLTASQAEVERLTAGIEKLSDEAENELLRLEAEVSRLRGELGEVRADMAKQAEGYRKVAFPLQERAERYRRALEQWKCDLCSGAKMVPTWRYEDRPKLGESTKCRTCNGTGLHPIARTALETAECREAAEKSE